MRTLALLWLLFFTACGLQAAEPCMTIHSAAHTHTVAMASFASGTSERTTNTNLMSPLGPESKNGSRLE
jgi:hypothetical protein